MGIIMDDYPAVQLKSDASILCSEAPSTLLQNADGWTRWWNQPEFSSYNTLFGYIDGAKAKGTWTSTQTLNAFKYFSDDLAKDGEFNPDPLKRGFFSSESPGINTRRYDLQFPMDSGKPVIHFKYAISASYAAPFDTAVSPYTADEWPITANMPEAYKIDIIDNGSTAFYTLTTSGGDLNLLVEVRDWQLDGTPGSVTSEISSVTLESPTLFPNPIDLDLKEAMFVPGNQTAIRFPLTISDVTPTSAADQLLIVTVKSGNPITYEPQLPGGSNFKYPAGQLAAYNIVEAPISSNPLPSEWHFSTIDAGSFSGNRMLDTSPNGCPHIAYRSYPDGNLKYAYIGGDAWIYLSTTYPVDDSEGMQVDSKYHPWCVYCPAGRQGVSCGNFDGAKWETWLLYTPWPGTGSSIALDSSDHPHLAIHGGGGGGQGVWHYWYDGNAWQSEHPVSGDQLIEPSIAIDSKDHVHILTFFMYGTSIMHHLYNDGTGWQNEDLGQGGNAVCLRIDSLDHLHVAYGIGAGGDPTNHLGYAFNPGGGWKFADVDDSSDLRQPSLAVDSQNHPHISYWDVSAKALKYAYFDGSTWSIETVQASGVGWGSSIDILPGDKPCIAYMDTTNTKILYAWKG